LPKKIDEMFDLQTHPSIEAMVVDRADEIAYMSHDIDDGVNSEYITFDDLKESELACEILQKVKDEGINEDEEEMFRYRFSSHMINHLVYSLLDYPRDKVDNSQILSATFDCKSQIPIGFDSELETKIKKLKKLLFTKMYQHKNIVRKMYAGGQAVKGIYKALMDEDKMLPKFYYTQLESRAKHRVIADYIASMSDRYALSFYNEIYGRI
jgi:dGTPase